MAGKEEDSKFSATDPEEWRREKKKLMIVSGIIIGFFLVVMGAASCLFGNGCA